MAGFGLPNFGQLTEAFKKAKQIQQDAQKLQDELENMEIEGKSDDEMIKVWTVSYTHLTLPTTYSV